MIGYEELMLYFDKSLMELLNSNGF